MKVISAILLTALCISGISQTKRRVSTRIKQNTTTRNYTSGAASVNNQQPGNVSPVQPHETATDRYLNGSSRKPANSATQTNNSTDNSPFVGGVHAADNAAKTFDTVAARTNTSGNPVTTNTTVTGGRDTIFNSNTINQGGVTTNSGAVDRSGQSQFGQTNWGNSRSTVGESQWTIPPPVTASFNKDFPASNNATWTRNNADSSIYSARYKSGTQWVTTNYNTAGQRLDMRTEFPLVDPPRSVSVYMAKQPAGFQLSTIYKLQVQGKADVYEIKTSAGKIIYVNNDGMEVNY